MMWFLKDDVLKIKNKKIKKARSKERGVEMKGLEP